MKKILIFLGVVSCCTALGFIFIGIGLLITDNLSSDLSSGRFIKEDASAICIKSILFVNHLFSFILSALILAKIYRNKNFIPYSGFNLKIDFKLLWLLTLLFVLLYPTAGLVTQLISKLDLPSAMDDLNSHNKKSLELLLNMNGPFDLIINLLVIGLLPGIGEEMLFRGVMQNELQRTMKSKYLPLILTAFVFSAMHLDPTGFAAKFFIGCGLGYAYFITKNIFYPMIIHALNNGMQVLLIYLSDTKISKVENDISDIAPFLIASTISWFVIYFLFKKIKNYHIDGTST